MKITKDYLRQIIRESLEEASQNNQERQKRIVAAAAQRCLPTNFRPAAALEMLKKANISPTLAIDYANAAMVQYSSSPKAKIYEEAYNKLIDVLKKEYNIQ